MPVCERSLKWPAAGLLLVAAFGVGDAIAGAQAGDAAGKPSAPAKAEVLRTRVFRLSLSDPVEVKQVLEPLLEPPPSPGEWVRDFGFVPPGPVPSGAPAILASVVRVGGPGCDLHVRFSGYVAADARTRSLVVRGTEKELQIAADLVAVLEMPDDKPLPQFKSLRAFSLKHADADELADVLYQLEPEVQIAALPEAKLLIVVGSEEAMKDLGDAIKELDVPTKESPKPEKQRKLLRPRDRSSE